MARRADLRTVNLQESYRPSDGPCRWRACALKDLSNSYRETLVVEFFLRRMRSIFGLASAFALVLAEVLVGNFILFFIGIASIITGIALWIGMPADNGLPFLLFATLSIALLIGLRSKMRSVAVGDVASSSIDEDFVGRDVQIESGFDEASQGAAESTIVALLGMHAVNKRICLTVVLRPFSRESNLLFIGNARINYGYELTVWRVGRDSCNRGADKDCQGGPPA